MGPKSCFLVLIPIFGLVKSQCEPPILDTLFLIDSTPAVGNADHTKIKDFLTTFAQKMDIGVQASRVGVLQFTPMARPEFYPNHYMTKNLVLDAMPTIPYVPCPDVASCYGATNINASVPYVASLGLSTGVGNRPEIDDAIIIVTPGVYRPVALPNPSTVPSVVSKRHVFVVKVGSTGSASGYTVPFASSVNELQTNNFDTLTNLVEPLCEEIVAVVSGNQVASASVVSGCAAPILIILLVALLFLALMGFVLFRMSKKNKELEKQVKLMSKWAGNNTTSKSAQDAQRGTDSAKSWGSRVSKHTEGGVSRNDGRYSTLEEEQQANETNISDLEIEEDGSRQHSGNSHDREIAIIEGGRASQGGSQRGSESGRKSQEEEEGKGKRKKKRRSVSPDRRVTPVRTPSITRGGDLNLHNQPSQYHQNLLLDEQQPDLGESLNVGDSASVMKMRKNASVNKDRHPYSVVKTTSKAKQQREISEKERAVTHQSILIDGDREQSDIYQSSDEDKEERRNVVPVTRRRGEAARSESENDNDRESEIDDKKTIRNVPIHPLARKQKTPSAAAQKTAKSYGSFQESVTLSIQSGDSAEDEGPSPREDHKRKKKLSRQHSAKPAATQGSAPREQYTAKYHAGRSAGSFVDDSDVVPSDPEQETPRVHKKPPMPKPESTYTAQTGMQQPEKQVKKVKAPAPSNGAQRVALREQKEERLIASDSETISRKRSTQRHGGTIQVAPAPKLSARKVPPVLSSSQRSTSNIESSSVFEKQSRHGSTEKVAEVQKKPIRKVPPMLAASHRSTSNIESSSVVSKDSISLDTNSLRSFKRISERREESHQDNEPVQTTIMTSEQRSSPRRSVSLDRPKRNEVRSQIPTSNHQTYLQQQQKRIEPEPPPFKISKSYPKVNKHAARAEEKEGSGSDDEASTDDDDDGDNNQDPTQNRGNTAVFFDNLKTQNKKHDPWRLPADHPAMHLPPVDLMLLVDNSGSIGNHNFLRVKEFVMKLTHDVNVAPGKSRFAVVLFNNEPSMYFSFDRYYTSPAVEAAIERMPYSGGGTHLAKALDYVTSFLQKSAAKNKKQKKDKKLQCLALISDAYTEDDIEPACENLHNNTEARIAAVGVRGYHRDRLQIITRDPESIFLLSDSEELANWLFKQQFLWQESHGMADATGVERAKTMVVGTEASKNMAQTRF